MEHGAAAEHDVQHGEIRNFAVVEHGCAIHVGAHDLHRVALVDDLYADSAVLARAQRVFAPQDGRSTTARGLSVFHMASRAATLFRKSSTSAAAVGAAAKALILRGFARVLSRRG